MWKGKSVRSASVCHLTLKAFGVRRSWGRPYLRGLTALVTCYSLHWWLSKYLAVSAKRPLLPLLQFDLQSSSSNVVTWPYGYNTTVVRVRTMKAEGSVEVHLHSFSTSVLSRGQCILDTRWIGGWMGLGSDVDGLEKIQTRYPCPWSLLGQSRPCRMRSYVQVPLIWLLPLVTGQ